MNVYVNKNVNEILVFYLYILSKVLPTKDLDKWSSEGFQYKLVSFFPAGAQKHSVWPDGAKTYRRS